jgi:hypothetical protein
MPFESSILSRLIHNISDKITLLLELKAVQLSCTRKSKKWKKVNLEPLTLLRSATAEILSE